MLAIRSERVVLPDGVRPATILVRDGRVAAINAHSDRPVGVRAIDAGARVVLPGLVDTHVHVNDPGRADWEGFASATRAAAAGGVTTIVDMPLNSIPATTNVPALAAKRAAATGRCQVDVAFWGGVVPGNVADLEPLAGAGVLGFKCFLSPSGVDEFPNVSTSDLCQAMPVLARLQLPLLVHAELPANLLAPVGDPRRYATWLASRPASAEHGAIDLLIGLARSHRTPVHIVHLASADALPALRAARHEGVQVTVETCPHYLMFAAEEIRDGATAFKCAPPIREAAHRERLWQALVDGDIDLVATDHSPAPPAMKAIDSGDFVRAWGGIASLQLGLAVVWTGARARGLPIERLARLLAVNPARLAGLGQRKGSIAVGYDADLAIWDPDAAGTITAATLYHRHPITPYDGARLAGRVHSTLVRGEVVYEEGLCRGGANGQLLSRSVA